MQDDFYQNSTSSTTTQQTRTNVGSAQAATDSLNVIAGWSFGILIVLLALGAGIYGGIRLARKRILEAKKTKDWKETVFLEISVPRETAEQSQKESGSKKDDKDILALGEQIFAVMSEYAQGGFKDWMFGGERFSLEIVNIEQEIRFWLVCSLRTAEVLEKQIIAVYPRANFNRLQEVKFFGENSVSYSQELTLGNRFELPFRTYRLMEHDPLNALTNAMSGIARTESAAIQLVLTPVKESWQKKPRLLALKIQQGQSPEEILFAKTNYSKYIGEFFKFLAETWQKGNKKDDNLPQRKERKIDLTGKEMELRLTPQQQEMIKKLEEKASKPGFHFTLRVISAAGSEARAKQIVDNIIPAFQIFDIKPFNWFKKKNTNPKQSVLDFILRAPALNNSQIINVEEINSLWHLPNYLTQTPNIKWMLARRPPIPLEVPGPGEDTVYLGTANSRGQSKDCYLKLEDRYRHIYSLGGSGSGKTVEMLNIALQDIEAGRGICLVDPHGEGVDDILRRIPPERMDDVIIFSPSITDRPLGLNMLETDPLKPTQKTLVIDTLFTIWDKLYNLKQTGGPMFENYMKNSMRLVMSHPESGATLMEIPKVLSDEDFRAFKLAMCDEQEVVDFWDKEATKAGGEASLENMVPYITSKLAPFITNDFIRPMIGQQKSAINWRQAMDNNKIILVSLSKGLIGETSAYLVGMVILGGLLMAGMGRSDGLKYNMDGTTTPITPNERTPFFVYIDEMQNFLFDAIPKALEEIRKYKVGFYLAHQFIKQVVVQGDERIKDSIMANCASKFIYRCSSEDATYLEKEFAPLSIQDIANPEARTYNAILLVDGQRTTPFNISATYPKFFEITKDKNKMKEAEEKRRQLIEMTKQKYGKTREEVEKEIRDRAKLLF